MQHSTKRIITTHAGSLPRPADMIEMLVAKAEGKPIDEEAQRARLPGAVKEIVNKQIELGLDVIDDGEYSKPSFVTYVNDRLAGFEPDPSAPRRGSWLESREGLAFPDCGFATFAGSKEVHPSIVWAKFEALDEGARLASKELWKKSAAKKAPVKKAVAKSAAKKKPAKKARAKK
jgi:methionine synthase II (cobalamin-independent)